MAGVVTSAINQVWLGYGRAVPAGMIVHAQAMADRLLERIERVVSGDSPKDSEVRPA